MNLHKIETQAFVQRMFSHYLQTGMNSQEAISTLSNKLGKPYQAAIRALEVDASTDETQHSNIASASFMSSLLHDTKQFGGNTEQLATDSHNALRKIAPGVKACARFFSVIFAYPIIISLIALIVYTFYKTFVFPQMLSIYTANEMPGLTRLIFSDVAGTIIWIVTVLIALFLGFQIVGLLTSFSTIKPRSSILGRLTGVSEHHSYLVFLAYLKVLLETKPDALPAQLIDSANRYSSMESMSSSYYRNHKAAITLLSESSNEDLLKEVEYQMDDVMSCLEQAFISRQEKLLFIFQISIFIFVGFMIAAMYMPIFKLGSSL